MRVLRRPDRQAGRMTAVGIADCAALFAIGGVMAVAQDREQPGAEIAACDEAVEMHPRLEERLLHQIVGAVRIA